MISNRSRSDVSLPNPANCCFVFELDIETVAVLPLSVSELQKEEVTLRIIRLKPFN